MSLLRNLGHDLVDKKLWPLAVVLLVALVAVPVVLGGPASTTGPASAAGPTGAAGLAAVHAPEPTAGAAIASVAQESPLRKRRGAVRDPFRQQHVPKASTATAKSVAAAPPTKAASPSSGTGGSTVKAAPAPKVAPPTTVKPAPKKQPTADPSPSAAKGYGVTLKFGEPGAQKTLRNPDRLSPLPNAEKPFFVFLGVLTGGKKAVFLISSDATASGDGTCRPTKANCTTIELEAGGTEFFDLDTENGVVQYQLDLVSVRRLTTSKDGAAAKAAASSGTALRATKEFSAGPGESFAVDAYRWKADEGVLERRAKSSSTSLRLPDGLAAALRVAAEEVASVADGAWHPGTP